MKFRFYLLIVFIAALLPMFAGCGGNSRGGKQVQKRGTVHFTVQWPRRTRLIPSAAQSIKVVLTANDQILAQQLVVRGAGDQPTSSVTFDSLPSVNVTATATAYPQPDGTGTAQASGATMISVQAEQTVQATLALDSAISQISLTPASPSVSIGQSVELIVTATDSSGNIVLVNPSAWKWSTDNSQVATVSAQGDRATFNGLSPGSVNLSITEQESGKNAVITASVLSLASGRRISGQVTDDSNQPLAGVAVETSNGTNLFSATSGSDGKYALDNIPAGQRVVTFATMGHSTTYQVTVANGGSLTLNAVLSASSTSVSGPPVILLNPPQVDQSNGQETVSGHIDQIDSSNAILIVNGSETLIAVASDGTFSTTAILRSGLNSIYIRATNSIGTTLSDGIQTTYTPGDNSFYFRVTLSWDGAGDIDLHTWDPNNNHSFYRNPNKQIPTGELDRDEVVQYGPENFTCRQLTPGRYKIAINAFSSDPGRRATVHVTINQGPNAGRSFDYGPYTFNGSDSNSDYPVTGNTDFWWRPVDIVADANGIISVQDADKTISLDQNNDKGARVNKKPVPTTRPADKARAFLHSSAPRPGASAGATSLPYSGRGTYLRRSNAPAAIGHS